MSGAERQKQRRDEARAAGLCGQCCKRRAKPGMFRCRQCFAGKGAVAKPKTAPVGNPFCLKCLAVHPRGVHVSVPQLLPRTA